MQLRSKLVVIEFEFYSDSVYTPFLVLQTTPSRMFFVCLVQFSFWCIWQLYGSSNLSNTTGIDNAIPINMTGIDNAIPINMTGIDNAIPINMTGM